MGRVCVTHGTVCAPAAAAAPFATTAKTRRIADGPRNHATAPGHYETVPPPGSSRGRGPAPGASLVELGRARAASHGDQPLYTFYPDRAGAAPAQLSYAGLDLRARAIGAALQREGAAGQRALLLYPPGLDFVAAFFGCLYGGVVAVPAYPPRSARNLPRLLEIARDARPAIALTTAELKAAIGGLATQVPELAALRRMATDEVPEAAAEAWRVGKECRSRWSPYH